MQLISTSILLLSATLSALAAPAPEAASPASYITSAPSRPSASAPPSAVAAPACTKVLTVRMRKSEQGGCTRTVTAQAETQRVDCGACAHLTTTTIFTGPQLGHGPVCVQGVQTVTDMTATTTVTSCAAKETASGYMVLE